MVSRRRPWNPIVKVKWKRKAESHSDESLWQLFNRFGQVDSVELTGGKVGREDDEGKDACWPMLPGGVRFDVSCVELMFFRLTMTVAGVFV
jgi:hypothetical protein